MVACQDTVKMIIEAKLADKVFSTTLMKFEQKYNYPAIQLIKSVRHERKQYNIQILKAEKFLAGLFL